MGTVFGAYQSGLEILHLVGKDHGNVDPISRIFEHVPEHVSPPDDDTPSLSASTTKEEDQPPSQAKPAGTFAVHAWCDFWPSVYQPTERSYCTKEGRLVTTRSNDRPVMVPETEKYATDPRTAGAKPPEEVECDYLSGDLSALTEFTDDEEEAEDTGLYEKRERWENDHPPPSIVVHLAPEYRTRFVEAYQKDVAFKGQWDKVTLSSDPWHPAQRYRKDEHGLLYFRDADFVPRLCVPIPERARIMREAHESLLYTAHAGPDKLLHALSSRFFWPCMSRDVKRYCAA